MGRESIVRRSAIQSETTGYWRGKSVSEMNVPTTKSAPPIASNLRNRGIIDLWCCVTVRASCIVSARWVRCQHEKETGPKGQDARRGADGLEKVGQSSIRAGVVLRDVQLRDAAWYAIERSGATNHTRDGVGPHRSSVDARRVADGSDEINTKLTHYRVLPGERPSLAERIGYAWVLRYLPAPAFTTAESMNIYASTAICLYRA